MKKVDLREQVRLAHGKSLKEVVRKHKARLRKKYEPTMVRVMRERYGEPK